MLGFLIRASIVALGLWLATVWVNGVFIDSPATLILAGVLLGMVNSIIRPIAIVLTLPMTIVTSRSVPAGHQRRHGGSGGVDTARHACGGLLVRVLDRRCW